VWRTGRLARCEHLSKRFLLDAQPGDAVKLITDGYAEAKGRRAGDKALADMSVAGAAAQATASLRSGNAVAAAKAASEAVSAARTAGSKLQHTQGLLLLLSAHSASGKLSAGLTAALEAVEAAKRCAARELEVLAYEAAVEVLLGLGETARAEMVAQEAVASLSKGAPPACGLAALALLSSVYQVGGSPPLALKAAKRGLELVSSTSSTSSRSNPRLEASALLLIADAYPGSQEAIESAKASISKFRELEDKSGQASALIALAFALGDQVEPELEEARQAGLDAVELFVAAGDESGGAALARCVASRACALLQQGEQANRLAVEAQQAFKKKGLALAATYASDLIIDTPFAALEQQGAKLLLDAEQKAHIEINESATQESLESIVTALHSYNTTGQHKWLKGLVLHIEGSPVPARLHSYAMATGTFLIGLRSLGVPIVSCCWGIVAGPTWALLLTGDYRLASEDTRFMIPILNPLECLPQLVGRSTATHLTMESGTVSAANLLEMSVIHQVQIDQDTTQKAAAEQAKRIANFPVLSSRQTLSCMCPDAEKYLLVH